MYEEMYDVKKMVLYPSPEVYQGLMREAERRQTSMTKVVMMLLQENLLEDQAEEH